MPKQSPIRVFISHAKEDEKLAILLKKFLGNNFTNAVFFVSASDLVGGEVWVEQLRVNLDSAKVLIALVSPYSIDNKWVYFEAGAGFPGQKLIPLLTDGVVFKTLTEPFNLLKGYQFDAKGLKALVRDISLHINTRRSTSYLGLEDTLTNAKKVMRLRKAKRNRMTKPQDESGKAIGNIDKKENEFLIEGMKLFEGDEYSIDRTLKQMSEDYLAIPHSVPWTDRVREKDEFADRMAEYVIRNNISREMLALQKNNGLFLALSNTIRLLPQKGDADLLLTIRTQIEGRALHLKYNIVLAVRSLIENRMLSSTQAVEVKGMLNTFRVDADTPLLRRIQRVESMIDNYLKSTGGGS